MRLLIVDDEQPARDRLRRILEEEDNYEVVGEAGNGLDAIAMAARRYSTAYSANAAHVLCATSVRMKPR